MVTIYCVEATDLTAGRNPIPCLHVVTNRDDVLNFSGRAWHKVSIWSVEVYALTAPVVAWLARLSSMKLQSPNDAPEGVRVKRMIVTP